MSEMEYNKGTLYLVSSDVMEYANAVVSDEQIGDLYKNKGEYLLNYCEKFGVEVINSKVYKVKWEVERGDLEEIRRAHTNEDGSISFETYHYNGCAHWTEVVELAIEEMEEGE